MKKYRCPKCGETFRGEQEVCPKCGTTLHYRKKEEIKEENEAKIVQKFNFEDPDIIKHEDKIPETQLIQDEDKEEKQEAKAVPTKVDVNVALKNGDSFFDGRLIQIIGWGLLAGLLTIVTAGIALPWAVCMIYRWEIKHTIVQGHRLKFTGKGGQLFGRYLLWFLLMILTVFIFSLWVGIFFKKWKTKHIEFFD